jgi:hypothetical protein
VVQSKPGQIVHETLFQKNPSQKKGLAEWISVDPEFKPQYRKKKKKKRKKHICPSTGEWVHKTVI